MFQAALVYKPLAVSGKFKLSNMHLIILFGVQGLGMQILPLDFSTHEAQAVGY